MAFAPAAANRPIDPTMKYCTTLFVPSFRPLMYALKLGILLKSGAAFSDPPKGLSKLVGPEALAVVVVLLADRLCDSGVTAVRIRVVEVGLGRACRVHCLAAEVAA